jgi:hypothetical protein
MFGKTSMTIFYNSHSKYNRTINPNTPDLMIDQET